MILGDGTGYSNPLVHISPPCVGDGTGSNLDRRAQGGETSSSSGAVAVSNASVKRQRCSPSTGEQELDGHIYEEGESMDDVLRVMQSPDWYYGPEGPGGTATEP